MPRQSYVKSDNFSQVMSLESTLVGLENKKKKKEWPNLYYYLGTQN